MDLDPASRQHAGVYTELLLNGCELSLDWAQPLATGIHSELSLKSLRVLTFHQSVVFDATLIVINVSLALTASGFVLVKALIWPIPPWMIEA